MTRGVGERLFEGGDLWRDGYYSRNYSISFIVYYSIILMRSLAYFSLNTVPYQEHERWVKQTTNYCIFLLINLLKMSLENRWKGISETLN